VNALVNAYAEDADQHAKRRSGHAISLRHVADIVAERREPRWLVRRVLEAAVLAVLAGQRGTLKSFIALHWSMLAALDGRCVVILSAEGAGLDRRIDAWMRVHGQHADLRNLNVRAIERHLNLSSPDVVRQLVAAFAAAGIKPDLIVVDTFSKYAAGIDENDNAEVAKFLALLSTGLRDEYGATVLLVAHAGHGDARRPRGASALMANPDAEYIVERSDPSAMSVTVTRERFKDCEALPPLAYQARVIDLGRADDDGQPVTSLVLAENAPSATKPRAAGANQQAALVALREWSRANPASYVIDSATMTALLKGQGIGAKRKPEVLNWLVNASVLTPSVGGHTVNRDAL
jgi:hypothetical protein